MTRTKREPAPIMITHSFDQEIDITPESARVHPWRIAAASPDFDYKQNRGFRVAIQQIAFASIPAGAGGVWLEGTVYPQSANIGPMDVDGYVEIDQLEAFAGALLAVVREVRRAHPEIGTTDSPRAATIRRPYTVELTDKGLAAAHTYTEETSR